MKNKIFKFIAVALIGISISGCGLFRKGGNTDTSMYGTTVMYNSAQLDSMCVADTLPVGLENWGTMSYMDYETSVIISRYTFIKTMSETDEMVYIVTPKDSLYKVTKRYVKETKEDKK